MSRTRRSGFTLIELLIVIVIIGILAAIAIPKFGKTREKAYFKAMQVDLRNLMTAQEIYQSNPANDLNYATDLTALGDFAISSGVSITIVDASNTGWGATASHQALGTGQTCALFSGTVSSVPSPALAPGIITCTGD